MKNQFVLLIMMLLLKGASISQWQPDIRLTNDPSGSFTSYTKCIAASGNNIHVTWMDLRTGNLEIFYKRSTDGGTSWGVDIRMTNNTVDSDYPAISSSGQLVHIVWQDRRDTNIEIYYKRSADGGATWGADTRLTNSPFLSGYPSVSSSGSDVHVVWYDTRDLNAEIYYKHSTNGGLSWGADTRLTNNPAGSEYPSISTSGTFVHVVWFDNRNTNNVIYYKRSTDNGISWGADTRVTYTTYDCRFPSVSASGSSVHVAWSDPRNSNMEIYYNSSTDGGTTWGGFDTRLTPNSANSEHPSISASGLNVHLVYENNQNTNLQIYYRKSTNAGLNWSGETRLTNTAYTSARPSVAVSGNVVHAVWHDSRNVNEDIYYKRDLMGNPVGVTGNSSGIPKDFSLSQNYPNPFNPTTSIGFRIADFGFVSVKVFDITGKEIAILVNEDLSAGAYNVDFDASQYSSGIYFYSMKTGNYSGTRKMVLIK